MENDFIKFLWGAIVTLVLPFIGFFTKRAINELDEVRKKTSQHELDLANYKTHVSDNYAKDATVQSSLARIHDRIDEVGDDIKTLIAKVK